LGEVVDYKNGAAHENCVVDDGDYVIVNSKFVSTEGRVAKFSNENRCPVNKDEILMVLSDVPNGKAIAKCYYVEVNNKYTLNQRICSFKTDKMDTKYLFLILNRNPYYLQFDDGVKQTNLRNEDVLKCPLNLPPTKEEQKTIAQILTDMENEIEQLEYKKAKYQNIKQGMMQELLTGKKRLV
jgi:type I restriction enzyme S subunit